MIQIKDAVVLSAEGEPTIYLVRAHWRYALVACRTFGKVEAIKAIRLETGLGLRESRFVWDAAKQEVL